MRELKFRAWDKLDKEFAQNIDCLLDMRTPERVFALDDENGELIIEQYTGLKDKNGKEIYEGDIVKLTGKVAKNKSTIYKVVWDSFLTGYDLISLERGKADVGYLNEVAMEERYDVIGNIHENYELLEEE